MNEVTRSAILCCLISGFPYTGSAQEMLQLGEVILVSNSPLKEDAKPEAFRSFIVDEVVPKWNASPAGNSIHLLQADRRSDSGEEIGTYLLAVTIDKTPERRSELTGDNPFSDRSFAAHAGTATRISDFLMDATAYTEYSLVGPDKCGPLPAVGILGIHKIKVRAERAREFEEFVQDRLHPALAKLLPDMGLFYYKATAGQNQGSYITIFAIKSWAAREKYWPTNAPETEITKTAFRPLKDLAKALGTYLVEGSYLSPDSGGAAAYFESLEWTDFVLIK